MYAYISINIARLNGRFAESLPEDAREAKAAMIGELKALKSHNDQLAVLLAGKTEPAAVKAKK